MQDFSIHDVRFRRAAPDKCWIVVRGETVGDVQLVPPPDDPDDPSFGYRIALHDSGEEPRFVHRRRQVRLAIADRLWEDGLVPDPSPGVIAAGHTRSAFTRG